MNRLDFFRRIVLLFGVLFLVVGFNSCSSDDEQDLEPVALVPKGSVEVGDEAWLYNQEIFVMTTVSQISFLAAVEIGDENTNNFIAQPVKVFAGTTYVGLIFDENVIPDDYGGKMVVLKLYADNSSSGLRGKWDESDVLIKDSNNVPLIKTVNVVTYSDFKYFDTNRDQVLNFNEALTSFNYYFSYYYGNKAINKEEFYSLIFFNTDFNWDDSLSIEEWNFAYDALFKNHIQDEFQKFDEDQNGMLSREEWNQILEKVIWFEAYDINGDGQVTQEEQNMGLFKDFDSNSDDEIQENEFNNYYSLLSSLYWW